MKDGKSTAGSKPTFGMLTRERGEKISAVEGLKLSPRMQAILSRPGLTGDQRRALIRNAFAAKSSE